ncbi:hypothetical protein, partial [Amycolatopsis sp. NPDC003731]
MTKRRIELLDEVLHTVPEADPVPDVLQDASGLRKAARPRDTPAVTTTAARPVLDEPAARRVKPCPGRTPA